MEINVAQLLKESVGSERHYRLDLEGEEAHYLDEVFRAEGKVRLLKLTQSIMVTGRIKALVEISCVRCLDSFRQEVSFELRDEYIPSVDVSSGAGLPPPEDATSFVIGPDHVVYLKEALRQYTILAMPMKPICQQDCRGICPRCGVNLNRETCRCIANVPDSRLGPLAELKTRLV